MNLTAHLAQKMNAGSTKLAGDNSAAGKVAVAEDYLAKLAADIDQELAASEAIPAAAAPVAATPDAQAAIAQTQPIVDATSAAAGGRPDLVAQAATPVQPTPTTDTSLYGTMDNGAVQDKNTIGVCAEGCLTPEETVKVAAEARVFYAEMQKIATEEALPGAITKLASYGMIHPSVNLSAYFSKEAADGYEEGDTLMKIASGELSNPTAEQLVLAAAEFDKIAEDIAEAELAGEAQAYADVEKLAAEIEAEQEGNSEMEQALLEAYQLGAQEASSSSEDATLQQMMKDPEFVALAKKYGVNA